MTKILLVEDDKSLREIYGTRLLAENYDIVSAGDGEEALAMAIKEKPDLIISDVMMPKISGFDMLDILRSTTETRDIKVIMMTALSSDDQRERGGQLGADKYLVKSQVGIEDVVRTVHEILGDSGAASSAPADSSTPAPSDTTVTSEPESTPSTDTVNSEPVEQVTEEVANEPVESTDAPEPTPAVSAGSAPGNDAAGPLPPQPSEVAAESTLPEPTAPFSSPRPTNLGENVVHPDSPSVEPAPVATPDATSAAPAVEAAPQDLSQPTVEPVAAGGLGFDAPASPAATDAANPVAPADPAQSQAPSDDKNETPPPTIGSVSTPL